MNQSLADIFKNKQPSVASGTPIDWDERREQYLRAVKNLYEQIERLLVEPIEQKTATLSRRPKELSENYIGTYKADDLILLAGDEQVRFSPRGRNIVGASGRVDVLGERGEEILVVQPDGVWRFVESRQPTLKTVGLDEMSLAEALARVMRS